MQAPPPPHIIIRWEDHILVPWKNGLGFTRQVFVERQDGMEGFVARVSVARVETSGPFSDFTGYDRVIMVIEGSGMKLTHADHGEVLLDQKFVPARFDGAWKTSSELLDGPISDFNVMVAQGRATATVNVVECPVDATSGAGARSGVEANNTETDGAAVDIECNSDITLVYVLQGQIRVDQNDDVLSMGDALLVRGQQSSSSVSLFATLPSAVICVTAMSLTAGGENTAK
ncbi:But2 domain-containing protein [Balamuthia mandrillaris]